SLDILIFHMIFLKISSYYSITENSFYNMSASIIFSLLIGYTIKKYIPQLYGKFNTKNTDITKKIA
ncbi:hypothetical protein, partial [Photobacterium kishitanii]